MCLTREQRSSYRSARSQRKQKSLTQVESVQDIFMMIKIVWRIEVSKNSHFNWWWWGELRKGRLDMCDYQSATANKTTVWKNNHLLKTTYFVSVIWVLHYQHSPSCIWIPAMFSSNSFAAASHHLSQSVPQAALCCIAPPTDEPVMIWAAPGCLPLAQIHTTEPLQRLGQLQRVSMLLPLP